MKHNSLLEARLDALRGCLDRLALAVDKNLRLLLLRLTCDRGISSGPLQSIDHISRETRECCLLLVARQSPIASDLKFAMAALRVEHDYCRMHELADALNLRIEHLRGTAIQKVIENMTGAMADILDLHEIVRKTWRAEGVSAAQLPLEVAAGARKITAGIAAIQSETTDAIARAAGSPELLVELVLACRHLQRIADLIESIPNEQHSFDKAPAG